MPFRRILAAAASAAVAAVLAATAATAIAQVAPGPATPQVAPPAAVTPVAPVSGGAPVAAAGPAVATVAAMPGAAAAPAIAASSYVLVDWTSGQTIVAQNADERRDPASLTKLMTAYLTFAALKAGTITPSQPVPVSERAWRAEGSRMFIEPRRAVSVDELLRGMIVQSGNDASIALAELVAGSEDAFAQRMNDEAKKLGLANTSFVNATGLSHPQHYSTAADMAKLAAALIRDFPEYYPLYAIKDYRYNNITQANRNRLLWTDPYVDGVKTGHTDAAGWCLIASAKRGDRRLVSAVLGAASDNARAAESQKLLNYGFQSFDTIQLYAPGQPVSTLRVWKGAANDVGAGFVANRYLTLPKGKAEKLQLTMLATEPLVAPVAKGQRVGAVKVALDGALVAEFPLVALADVSGASFIGRAWDTVRLWFR
jgi:serine-type D-Ala-D-Ala carboxypeptidase (penicillin-binding protein 5/6)